MGNPPKPSIFPKRSNEEQPAKDVADKHVRRRNIPYIGWGVKNNVAFRPVFWGVQEAISNFSLRKARRGSYLKAYKHRLLPSQETAS
jgi:hypothetical protein